MNNGQLELTIVFRHEKHPKGRINVQLLGCSSHGALFFWVLLSVDVRALVWTLASVLVLALALHWAQTLVLASASASASASTDQYELLKLPPGNTQPSKITEYISQPSTSRGTDLMPAPPQPDYGDVQPPHATPAGS